MRSIAKSTFRPSKKAWADKLQGYLGKKYVMLHSVSLVAIHLVVFVHESLIGLVSQIKVSNIATGIFQKVGNKGGVGISLNIGSSSLLLINCHLASG